MATTRNVYAIDRFKKLIDLNGDTTNFDISFSVRSQNGEPFDILVVDQTTLDNTPNLEYKKAPGEISGNLVHDKNVYQNYYIILRADKPCNCEVEIIKKELPKTSQQPIPVQTAEKPKEDDFDDIFYWVKIAVSIGVVTGILALLYWTSRKEEEPLPKFVPAPELPANLPSPPPSNAGDFMSNGIMSPRPQIVKTGNPILDRLNKVM